MNRLPQGNIRATAGDGNPLRRLLRIVCCVWLAQLLQYGPFAPVTTAADDSRPNIVWIMTEDNSVHYSQLYRPDGAATPELAALAAEGVVFERAYSNAPVCSVARTTLITGCYAPRLSTQYHRRSQMVTLPDGLEMFPYYLREAGYFTTNNRKQDYNAHGAGRAWDVSSGKASWRQRPDDDTPFFHVQTLTTTHESSLHFNRQRFERQPAQHSPQAIEPHPYLPDTPLVRYTHAYYLDRHQQMDRQIGELIERLKRDGLWGRTVVFVFGDHGGVLPRSKGYIYDTGLHVPLVVRVPERYRPRWDVTAGSRDSRYVEFVDFGPTVLSLAGIEPPEAIDGDAFLGRYAADDAAFEFALGYADRFDEKYDLTRSLHHDGYHYIRNYQAFYPDSLQNNYRYRMLAYDQWRTLYREGALEPQRAAFFESRPVEMLFDLSSDPFEIHNLAGDPAHTERLTQLRERLDSRLKSLPDTSFIPEPFAVPEAAHAPTRFATEQQQRIARLIETANLALASPSKVEQAWLDAATAPDRWQRYWALTAACSLAGPLPRSWLDEAERRTTDAEPLVRVRAALLRCLHAQEDPRPVILAALEQAGSEYEALMILNDLVYVRDGFESRFPFDPEQIHCPFGGGEVRRRLDYLGVTAEH